MQCRPFLVILFVAAGCATLPSAGPIPSDLAVNRRWSNNAGGYVFTVGYFTPEQVRSPAWEAARVASSATVHFCDNKEIVRRDVRWFEPIALGEPRCAAIVYSFACTPRRPEWGGSLEYERRQALLEPMDMPITANCGDKDGTRLPPSRIPPATDVVLAGRADLCRDLLPDLDTGRFLLRDVNYVRERTLVSDNYIRRSRPFSGHPASFLGHAAAAEQRLHFVISSRDLPHDRHNIFVDQVFTENNEGYCITLTARQGRALWRRTIKRDSYPVFNNAMRDRGQHSRSPGTYWDTYSDSHLLQHRLAVHLGLTIPADHPSDAAVGNP